MTNTEWNNETRHKNGKVVSAFRPGLCGDNLLTKQRRPQRSFSLANHLASTDNLTRTSKRQTNGTQKVALINSNSTLRKMVLRERTEPGLVAFYDIQPGNGAGLFLQPRSLDGVNISWRWCEIDASSFLPRNPEYQITEVMNIWHVWTSNVTVHTTKQRKQAYAQQSSEPADVVSSLCPLRSTHQQWPVLAWHCSARKKPSSSHCGTNAPTLVVTTPHPKAKQVSK